MTKCMSQRLIAGRLEEMLPGSKVILIPVTSFWWIFQVVSEV